MDGKERGGEKGEIHTNTKKKKNAKETTSNGEELSLRSALLSMGQVSG